MTEPTPSASKPGTRTSAESRTLTLAEIRQLVVSKRRKQPPPERCASDERSPQLAHSVDTEADAPQVLETWSADWRDPVKDLDQKHREQLEADAERITRKLQLAANRRDGYRPVHRGFQAKSLYATTNARLLVTENLPPLLEGRGFLARGARYRAIVRFSSASPAIHADGKPDQRAVAVRVTDDKGRTHDLTLTSGSGGNHARDAKAFIASIEAAEIKQRHPFTGLIRGLWKLWRTLGSRDAVRMTRTLFTSRSRGRSLAAHTFYSRAPFRLAGFAVKYRITPAAPVSPALQGRGGRDALLRDLVARQYLGDVRYKLQFQGYVDDGQTPLDDHRVDWPASASPWVTVAELVLPVTRGVTEASAHRVTWKVSNRLAFSPFNQWEEEFLEPLGELNMLRKRVYRASAENTARVGARAIGCPLHFLSLHRRPEHRPVEDDDALVEKSE